MSVAAAFRVMVAGVDDVAAVREVLAASFPVLLRDNYDPALLARMLPLLVAGNPALVAGGTYFIARDERGAVVGCGGWTAHPPGRGAAVPELGHMRYFAVRPEWGRTGVGRAIYAACVAQALADGMTAMQAEAALNAEAFYAALGFVVVARLSVAMGPEGIEMPVCRMRAEI